MLLGIFCQTYLVFPLLSSLFKRKIAYRKKTERDARLRTPRTFFGENTLSHFPLLGDSFYRHGLPSTELKKRLVKLINPLAKQNPHEKRWPMCFRT